MNPLKVSEQNIWQYAQNRPSLVCKDLADIADIATETTSKILMARGVYKWLAVRRDLIRLKNTWSTELTRLYRAIGRGTIKRGSPEHLEAKGRIKAIEECRAAIRALCHSQRWRWPDNDAPLF